MPKLKIRKYPNKILKQKAAKIKDPMDPKIKKLIPQMIETMKENNGLGLAAPQIGESLRLCIIDEGGVLYVLINPKIKSKSKKQILLEEGCLSFPGKFLPIKRAEKVKVRYINEKGIKSKIKAEGLLARALQHEIDHLDGILMISRTKK
ncbi:peptide deformylase [Patescibacteria group bacterium]